MEMKTEQGRSIRLPAEFFTRGIPADPKDPRLAVLDPSSRPVVVLAVPERDAKGLYHYDYEVAPNAPVGIWTVRWTATLNGLDLTGEDTFEVVPGQPDRTPLANRLAAVVAPERQGNGGGVLPAPAARSPEPAAVAVAAPNLPAGKPVTPPPARRESKPPTAETVADEQVGKRRGRGKLATKRNTRLAVALLICLVGVAFAAFQAEKGNVTRSERSFRLAEQALKGGAIDQARSHYLDIVLSDPGNTVAYFDLGMLAHLQNRGPEAQDFYLRALERDPTFLPALYNLAILKDASGKVDEAILLYRQILRETPEHAASHFNLGLILYNKKGQPEEGRELIEKAVRLDPTLGARASQAFGTPSPSPPQV
jgi:tetratricopeptide (TPR) repeat protein